MSCNDPWQIQLRPELSQLSRTPASFRSSHVTRPSMQQTCPAQLGLFPCRFDYFGASINRNWKIRSRGFWIELPILLNSCSQSLWESPFRRVTTKLRNGFFSYFCRKFPRVVLTAEQSQKRSIPLMQRKYKVMHQRHCTNRRKMFLTTLAVVSSILFSQATAHGGVTSYVINGEISSGHS